MVELVKQARYFHKKRQGFFLYVTVLPFVLSLCMLLNSPGNRGPVWIDELIVTSGFDADGEPIDQVEVLGPDVSRVYCFARITGPNQVQMGIRWYHEDQLIWTDVMAFGTGRTKAVFLAREGDQPFPPGNYRCEIYAVEKALQEARFRVEE